jgi:hypothetical protein
MSVCGDAAYSTNPQLATREPLPTFWQDVSDFPFRATLSLA